MGESNPKADGGGEGIRTPDLLIANETLYQLSYTPSRAAYVTHFSGGCNHGAL